MSDLRLGDLRLDDLYWQDYFDVLWRVPDEIAGLIAALKAGKAPTDVSELSPFTATHLRQVARDAGIEKPTTRRPPRRRT